MYKAFRSNSMKGEVMSNRNRLWSLLSAATVTCAACAALMPGSSTRLGNIARPQFSLGPAAVASNRSASNAYGLFTCQLGLDPGVNCYDPFQMRHAYGVDQLISAGYDGTGKTIVIVDAFQNPNIAIQLATFDAFYGIPDPNFNQIAPQGLTAFDPSNADMVGWAEEISLDVEWAHAIAPGANILLVLAKSDQDADIYAATKYAVDNHLGDVISQSFGENEACIDPKILAQQHQMFAEATQKRMTLFASSGDDGAGLPTCDNSGLVQAASTPAIDPLVTGVGGTELHATDYSFLLTGGPAAPPGTYEGEIVWNEADLGFGAGGGGFSLLFSEPSYQKSAIPGGKQRGVPDVTYNAAVLHGVLTFLDIPGLPAGFYLFGGTSAGSPQWSAITVIADEKNGADLGFLNQALYHIGSAPPHAAASFHDITVGNNSAFGVSGFSAGPGWDAASGLGSPKAPGLVDLLIQFVAPGDATAAIAQSAAKSNNNGKGHVTPH